MSRLGLARAWSAVHGTVPAATMLTVAGGVGILLGGRSVGGMGFVQFATPVSILLLLPLVSGVSVAVASVPAVPRSLPDPVKARVARVGWAIGWLVMAVVVGNLGQIAGAEVSPTAVARNVATYAGLGLMTSRIEGGRHVWVLPVVLSLIAMLFGHPDDGFGYHWWAWVMDDRVAADAFVLSVALLAIGLLVISMRRSPRPAN